MVIRIQIINIIQILSGEEQDAPIGRNIARCEPEDNMFVHKRLFFFKVARKQILHLLFYEICEKQGKDQGKV